MSLKIDGMTVDEMRDRLGMLRGLQRHPGYLVHQAWLADMQRYVFSQLMEATDPTSMAKAAGELKAYKTVSNRIQEEIDAFERDIKAAQGQ